MNNQMEGDKEDPAVQASPVTGFELAPQSLKMEEAATEAVVPENCSQSQLEAPEIEVMERSLEQSTTDWSDAECDGSLNNFSEFEDLLYHFDKFFRGRFETEIDLFKETVNNMLSEQNTHIRQIMQRVGNQCDIPNMDTESHDAVESDCSTTSDSGYEVSYGSFSKETKLISREDTTVYRQQSTTKDRLLVQLMSLSCALTSIFHRKEYKTF